METSAAGNVKYSLELVKDWYEKRRDYIDKGRLGAESAGILAAVSVGIDRGVDFYTSTLGKLIGAVGDKLGDVTSEAFDEYVIDNAAELTDIPVLNPMGDGTGISMEMPSPPDSGSSTNGTLRAGIADLYKSMGDQLNALSELVVPIEKLLSPDSTGTTVDRESNAAPPETQALIDSIAKKVQALVNTAAAQVDPIILDLDGNGVTTTSSNGSTYFDLDGNGYAEKTGWSTTDGILCRDLNSDGQIISSELFGNYTKLANGSTAANGFIALAELDVNKDGKITSVDNGWSTLKVWVDRNGNGKSDSGELLTLAQAGVGSLNVSYYSSSNVDSQGNSHAQIGSYTTTAGLNRAMEDVWFTRDTARTIDQTTQITISAEIAALPDIAGFGNVSSLRQSMARDTSGKLVSLVKQYFAAPIADRPAIFTNLIYQWAGVADKDSASRGTYIGDGRMIYALDAFLGTPFMQGGSWGSGTSSAGADVLKKAFKELSDSFESLLLYPSLSKQLLSKITLEWDSISKSFKYNVSDMMLELRSVSASNERMLNISIDTLKRIGQSSTAGAEIVTNIKKLASVDNTYFGIAISNLLRSITGTSSSETISGLAESSLIFAGAGNDTINTSTSAGISTVVYGEKGNDTINVGSKNDVLVFNSGDGQDTVSFASAIANQVAGNVIIKFGAGISKSSVTFDRLGFGDLRINYGVGDSITINDYFNYLSNRPVLNFSDGYEMNTPEILATLASNLSGTSSGYESLYGVNGYATTFNSRGGDDYIYPANTNDIINLNVGDGSDYVSFNKLVPSQAQSNISLNFGPGITRESLSYSHSDQGGLLIRYGTKDSVYLENYFSYASNRPTLKFSDGTVMSVSETLSAAASNLQGTSNGYEYLYGIAGYATTFSSKGGDDYIYIANSNDVVSLNIGDGADNINFSALGDNQSTNNVFLRFGPGVTKSSLSFSNPDQTGLLIRYGVNDSVYLNNYYKFISARPSLKFNDGSVMSTDDIFSALASALTGTNSYESLYGNTNYATSFFSKGGDDRIYPANSNDVINLNIGDGADTVYFSKLGLSQIATNVSLKFGSGITKEMLSFSNPNQSSLLIKYGPNDSVYLDNYFNYASARPALRFADGSSLTSVEIFTLVASNISGTTRGQEYLYGVTGYTSTFNSKGGDDYIYIANSNDVVNLNIGDGADYIYFDSLGNNQIPSNVSLSFGPGVSKSSLSYSNPDQSGLLIRYSPSDSVYLSNFYKYASSRPTLKFADGSAMSISEVFTAATSNLSGTNNYESMYGVAGYAITFNSKGGDDRIYPANSNDVINLNVGDGADTIYFSKLGLTQTPNSISLNFGPGITKDSLTFTNPNQSSLLIKYGVNDSVYLDNYFNYASARPVLKFADSSTMTAVEIMPLIASNIAGTNNGYEYLYGVTGFTSTFNSKAGNDYIYTANSNDVVNLNIGDGADTIYFDSLGNNQVANRVTLKFGPGITKQSLSYSHPDQTGLLIRYSASDSVYLSNYFSYASARPTLKFDDGTVMSISDTFVAATANLSGTNNYETLYGIAGYATTFNSKGGNDCIYPANINDIINLNVGDGEDRVYFSKLGLSQVVNGVSLNFGSGITKESLSYSHPDEASLLIRYGTNDSIYLENYFNYASARPTLKFADGSILTSAEIIPLLASSIVGTVYGYEYLYGVKGYTSTINSKAGNDYIYLANNNDRAIFSLGDGQDYLYCTTGTQTASSVLIDFTSSVNKDSVKFTRTSGTSTSLKISYGTSDAIYISDFFTYKSSQANLHFAGETQSIKAADALIQALSGLNFSSNAGTVSFRSIEANTTLIPMAA